jgi:hypothetical protein
MTYKYIFVYSDEVNYRVIQQYIGGESRIVPNDSKDIEDWIANGNEPDVVSGDRFVSIVDGMPVIDPKKAEILETERWDIIRGRRNEQLKETDWTQLADSPLSDEEKKTIATYRQSLRDLPQTYSDSDEGTAKLNESIPASIAVIIPSISRR